jgi:hypothetical protein
LRRQRASDAISKLSQIVEALSQEMKKMKTGGTEEVSVTNPPLTDSSLPGGGAAG